ncbi:hypothetical protein KBD45_01515 [Candidatus Dojkabacteria bacterium]|nr:hypothetical protein [Candidatus Dojkabacteria bacterium]
METIKNLKIRKLENLIFSIILMTCLLTPRVFGAELNLTSSSLDNKVGDQFEVVLRVNTQEESINAIEGKIKISENNLQIQEIRDGNSIMSLWINRPKIQSGGDISFSGIIPGGYIGDDGVVLTMVLQSTAAGSSKVSLSDVKLLRNDGSGSEADVNINDFQILITEIHNEAPKRVAVLEDTEPPESFRPEVMVNENVYGGKKFLVFSTLDKISGIDRYEVKEGDEDFIITESPYLLKNQILNKNIEVKVIDKAGNERTEIVYLNSENVQINTSNPFIYVVPILLTLLTVSILIVWKKPWLKK